MTDEQLLQAKIACAETGIEVRHSMCDMCTPGPQCGLDVYVKDGEIIKIEGTKGFPSNDGKLCAKGASNRQYVYRSDRIRTPLRRVGPRGSGHFEPISWDEALDICAEHLNRLKAESGPECAAFMCGYSKWFRAYLQRLCFSFGSPNYMTESSACHQADVMARKTLFGTDVDADMANAELVVLWGSNPYIFAYPLGRLLNERKRNGCRFIVIDPRNTESAQKLADLYLRPRLGTDGVLAHAMANYILEHGLQDQPYIDRYVHGFEAYRDYVRQFDLQTAERVTGVAAADIARAAEMFAKSGSAATMNGTAITHRVNGYNNVRAILSLSAITGRFDRRGGMLPVGDCVFAHSNSGFVSREIEYATQTRPNTDKLGVGLARFPLWAMLNDQCQGMALADQILSGEPYPIRAAVCFGVNHMMYPDSERFLRAMDKLDFIMAADIFMTDMCRHADVVLPACTSLERSEIKFYGPFVNYTNPAIQPVGESRDDVAIMAALAERLGLDDMLLRAGYDAGARYMLEAAGIEDWEAFRNANRPVPVPNCKMPKPHGQTLEEGLDTPSGKIELYSERIVLLNDERLNPLPVYADSNDGADAACYPFVMCAGARIGNAVHSRIHGNRWPRALRPDASVEINPTDAARLGVETGDAVEISTPNGAVQMKAIVTERTNCGELQCFHGYREANVNQLLSAEHLDPYTGFPGYKQFCCSLRKIEGGA